MKNLLIILSLLLCISCKQSNQESNDSSVILTGKISNASLDNLSVLADYAVRNKINIEDGQFKVEDTFEWPKLFSFIAGRDRVKCFLSPGDSLHVEFDEKDIAGTITFSGSHALENTILKSYSEYIDELEPDRETLFGKNEAEFISFLDSGKYKVEKFISKVYDENPSLDKRFKELLEADLYYTLAFKFDRYKAWHTRISGDTSYIESEAILSHKNGVEIDRPEALGSVEYTNYLVRKVWDMTRKYDKEDYKEEVELFLKNDLSNEFNNLASQDLIAFSILNSTFRRGRMDDFMDLITEFQRNASNPIFAEKLNQNMEAYSHLRQGESAPDFSYPDIENLPHSLSDYKGKIVYIDVWATWCKPCLAEQPALAELEEQYKDNDNIVFMGVSTDKDREAWEKMVKSKELKGVQLIKDYDADANISDLYKIQGIPRFILVDKDGSLADAYAPRPSSGEMEKVIEELLEENAQNKSSESSTL